VHLKAVSRPQMGAEPLPARQTSFHSSRFQIALGKSPQLVSLAQSSENAIRLEYALLN
jgi:hypothetical protein